MEEHVAGYSFANVFFSGREGCRGDPFQDTVDFCSWEALVWESSCGGLGHVFRFVLGQAQVANMSKQYKQGMFLLNA
jgi:hypothetical protein